MILNCGRCRNCLTLQSCNCNLYIEVICCLYSRNCGCDAIKTTSKPFILRLLLQLWTVT